MYRNQRKNARSSAKRNNIDGRDRETHLNNDNIEEVLPPKNRRNPFKTNKPMTNRCCYVIPDYKDEEQSTEYSGVDDQFHNLVLQQYDFDPTIPDTIKQLKELRKVLCGVTPKVENYSQYVNPKPPGLSYVETADGSQWQSIDNADDIDEYLSAEKANTFTNPIKSNGENIYISEVPNIKVIVEKFSKYKKNDVELRKLEEKIVCVEYDIFEKCEVEDNKTPVQKMRAYFSVKPKPDKDKEVPIIPSSVKRNFNITNEDLAKLNDKEIEIIDSTIAENKPYLDDLKQVLKRKQAITARKEKSSLDLMALYKMAKRETSALDFSATNLLSKAELEEIKDLVTNKCATSKHGINRRTLNKQKETTERIEKHNNVVSESIFAELLKNDLSTNKR